MKTRDRLKGIKSRIPYFRVKFPPKNVRELEETGKTVLQLSLRFNYPILTGLMYSKKDMAVIVKKSRKGKLFFYYLEAEDGGPK